LALVSALSMIQSGELNPGALFASPAPAQVIQTQSGKKKGKPPPLIPRDPTVQAEEITVAAEPETRPAYSLDPRRELSQALARMDGKAAAKLLVELDNSTAVELLTGLHERDLARILEAAEPMDAAPWVLAILEASPMETAPSTGDVSAIASAEPGGISSTSPEDMLTPDAASDESEAAGMETAPASGEAPVEGEPATAGEPDAGEETTTSTNATEGTDSSGGGAEEPPAEEETVARVAPARPPPIMNIA